MAGDRTIVLRNVNYTICVSGYVKIVDQFFRSSALWTSRTQFRLRQRVPFVAQILPVVVSPNLAMTVSVTVTLDTAYSILDTSNEV
jgi:hypothetical protein